ncbi:hypothetical protein [Phage Phass-1]|uniref:Uncharacterized protein n=1 Tax=Phage Phass-1 TaxID=3043662 RepID=A0AAF0LYB1_9CAUD|nr:hypothetical protein [Phage Phass-1]
MEFLFLYNSAARCRRRHSRYSSPNSTDGSFFTVGIKEENQPMGAWGCSPLELPSAYPPHTANEVPFIKSYCKYELDYLSPLNDAKEVPFWRNTMALAPK